MSPCKDDDTDKNKEVNSLTIDLLKDTRTVLVTEEVSSDLVAKVVPQLLWLDTQSQKPVTVLLNTPGGTIYDGFAIYDVIRHMKSPVNIVCIGLTASAGTFILLAAPKKRRYALPNTTLMIHQPRGGAQGVASDIVISAEHIVRLRERLVQIYTDETGRNKETVEKDMNRDYWMTSEEAKDYGLIGSIITSIYDAK